MTIAAAAHVGAVRLRVADIDAVTAFYERVIGLRMLAAEDGLVRLGADGGAPLVELVAAPDAPRRLPLSTGLFHLALLVPTRIDLADAIRRVGCAGWPLTGASDHLVSEALYLSDPEGNGIEIYRDRPREEWRYGAGGELAMATLPLDVRGVLSERAEVEHEPRPMAAGTGIGHVHLRVSDLDTSERFYARVLGLEVTVRSYPGALFVAAGGYHHHVGLNTWHSADAPRPPEDALGLDHWELVLPDATERDRLAAALQAAGVDVVEVEQGELATDPSGNRVLLRA